MSPRTLVRRLQTQTNAHKSRSRVIVIAAPRRSVRKNTSSTALCDWTMCLHLKQDCRDDPEQQHHPDFVGHFLVVILSVFSTRCHVTRTTFWNCSWLAWWRLRIPAVRYDNFSVPTGQRFLSTIAEEHIQGGSRTDKTPIIAPPPI